MAIEKPSSTNPTPQTPEALFALAERLRDHVRALRNPAAKATWGDDMLAAADVIDGIVSLYRDVHSSDSENALRAVLRLFPAAKEG